MERGCKNDEVVLGRTQALPVARPDNVAILGEPSTTGRSAVHPQGGTNPSRPSGPINVANVLQLLEWQDYRCALTGRRLTPETASLEHVVPVRDGGEHVMQNVQVLHKDINRAKATLAHRQFIDLCREVVEYAESAHREGGSR